MLISWIDEIVRTPFVPKGKTAVEVIDRQRLFVVFSAICEFAHPFAPLFIAAAFERISHQAFDLFFANAVFNLNVRESDMIRECHLDDFADVFG